MKFVYSICFLFIIWNVVHCQEVPKDLQKQLSDYYEVRIKELPKHQQSLANKVSVGMSIDEVRDKLGKPFAIESGFPKTEMLFIYELPEQVGQLNNSTWFYLFPQKSFSFISSKQNNYYINELPVSEYVYQQYYGKSEVYIYADKIISPGEADTYKLLKDKKLKTAAVNKALTYMEELKPEKQKISVIPVLCVIFDKGTQSVAATKVFYKS